MPDISISKISDTVFRAQVKLKEEESAALFLVAQERVREHAKLPGFRKGKVPEHLIWQKFKEEIGVELEILALEYSLKEIEKKTQQKIYEVEKIEDIDIDKKNLTLNLVYQVFPYVKLAKLKKGYVREYEQVILEKEVQSSIRRNLSEFAQYFPKEIGEPITTEDVVTGEYEILVDGIPISEAKEISVDLNDYLTQEFELLKEKLIKNPNLAKEEILIDLPTKNKEKKQLIFTVKKIQKKILPELTDEFIKEKYQVFQLNTVEDFRKFLIDLLKNAFLASSRELAAQEAIQRLMEESEFFISEKAIEREVWNILLRLGKNKVSSEEFTKLKKDIQHLIEKEIRHSLTIQSLLQIAKEKNYLTEEILLQKFQTYPGMEQKIKGELAKMILAFTQGYYDEKYPAFFVYFPPDLQRVVYHILYEFLAKEAGVKKGEKKSLTEINQLKKTFSFGK